MFVKNWNMYFAFLFYFNVNCMIQAIHVVFGCFSMHRTVSSRLVLWKWHQYLSRACEWLLTRNNLRTITTGNRLCLSPPYFWGRGRHPGMREEELWGNIVWSSPILAVRCKGSWEMIPVRLNKTDHFRLVRPGSSHHPVGQHRYRLLSGGLWLSILCSKDILVTVGQVLSAFPPGCRRLAQTVYFNFLVPW